MKSDRHLFSADKCACNAFLSGVRGGESRRKRQKSALFDKKVDLVVTKSKKSCIFANLKELKMQIYGKV